jgi:hypothetical protein
MRLRTIKDKQVGKDEDSKTALFESQFGQANDSMRIARRNTSHARTDQDSDTTVELTFFFSKDPKKFGRVLESDKANWSHKLAVMKARLLF